LIALLRTVLPSLPAMRDGGVTNMAGVFTLEMPSDTGSARKILADIAAAVTQGTLEPEQARAATAAITAWLASHETHELQKAHDLLKQEVSALKTRSTYRIAQ
jgi:hypothetical protein